jgi:hypothetical protein
VANLDHLVNGASKATGDTILAAGLFEPKGMAGKEFAGGVIGSVVGDAVGGDVGDDIGMAVGVGVGTASSAQEGKIRFVLAISATKVYVLEPESFDALHKEELRVQHTFDRATAHVTVHARVSVRTIVIEDPATGEKAELEGSRLWFKHSKAVIRMLLDDQFEPEESALDDAPPG